jgi:Glycerophosphoryl diester phosphodiesterase family
MPRTPAWALLGAALAASCGSAGSDTPGPADEDAGFVASGPDAAGTNPVDAGGRPPVDAGGGAVDADRPDATPAADASSLDAGADYRSSLSVCWTDASCKRVMAIGHGGLWNLTSAPYDSNAAISAAYAAGMDGVKIDVRVTADDVPVIAHSSPIQLYESVDCNGQYIEKMTAAAVTACHRFPSTTETFQRLDDVLGYLRGKMVTQLCVKLATDYGRTIQELIADSATDFAFIELASTSDLENIIPTLTGSSSAWYLVNVGTTSSDVDTILGLKNTRAFMIEFDPSVQLGNLVTTKLHPAGVRAFAFDNSATASVAELQGLFTEGFDVVSAQTGANDVQARIAVNTSRGVSPP